MKGMRFNTFAQWFEMILKPMYQSIVCSAYYDMKSAVIDYLNWRWVQEVHLRERSGAQETLRSKGKRLMYRFVQNRLGINEHLLLMQR
jgi:hypothetical protein